MVPGGSLATPADARNRERGSALPMVMVAAMSVGALAMAHLTKVMAELRKTRTRTYVDRAVAMAEGHLEIARNVVNAARYDDEGNTALLAAMASDDGTGRRLLPGTEVEIEVEPLGEEWFLLRARADYQGVRRIAQATVRARMPVTNYNYFVIAQKLGISGEPRGKIHSNDKIDFYFPNGVYRDEVTASNGFGYRNGATAENTRLLGDHADNVETKDILHGTTVADVAAKADALRVDRNLIAEVAFAGTTTRVDLFVPAHVIRVPYQTTENVLVGYRASVKTKRVPIEEIQTVDVTVTDYQNQQVVVQEQVPIYGTRQVTATETRRRWVTDAGGGGGGGGGDVSGGGSSGHWENYTVQVTRTERYVTGYTSRQVTRTVKVAIGTHSEQRQKKVVVGHRTETVTVQDPIYEQRPVTRYRDVSVPEQFLETRTVPTEGILYFAGPIRKLAGEIAGKVTVVTNESARITGSIQYVDGDGDKRMLHGLDPDQEYVPNPEYDGASVLAVMARDDIRYAAECPSHIEINAALISTDGTVAFDGIQVAADGETVRHDPGGRPAEAFRKESIRRLGGIVARERPVATYIDSQNNLVAGFKKGRSTMDRRMSMDSSGGIVPPGVLAEDRPAWGPASTGTIWRAEDIRGDH